MMVTTIQDDTTQICPICLEPLQLNKCSAYAFLLKHSIFFSNVFYSLKCQHLMCDECLPKVSKGVDETVKCAECRESTARDDVEKVYMTEQQRWDELLLVAQAWAVWDHRGEEETSEEEAEDDFIDGGTRYFMSYFARLKSY